MLGCDSVFKPDLLDARLPGYTEEGNNVGGALIDGSAWTIQHTCREPFTPYPNIRSSCRDRLIISYNGVATQLTMEEGSWLNEAENAELRTGISFTLHGVSVDSLQDVANWEEGEFKLDGVNSFATVATQAITYSIGTGSLFIRNVDPMRDLDGHVSEVLLSGTFAFTLPGNHEISEVTAGRFDFIITHSQIQ